MMVFPTTTPSYLPNTHGSFAARFHLLFLDGERNPYIICICEVLLLISLSPHPSSVLLISMGVPSLCVEEASPWEMNAPHWNPAIETFTYHLPLPPYVSISVIITVVTRIIISSPLYTHFPSTLCTPDGSHCIQQHHPGRD